MEYFLKIVKNYQPFFVLEKNLNLLNSNKNKIFLYWLDKLNYNDETLILELVEIIEDEPDLELLECSYPNIKNYLSEFENYNNELMKFFESHDYKKFVEEYNMIVNLFDVINQHNINTILTLLIFNNNTSYLNQLSILELDDLLNMSESQFNNKMSVLIKHIIEFRNNKIINEIENKLKSNTKNQMINTEFVLNKYKIYVSSLKNKNHFDSDVNEQIRKKINEIIKIRLEKNIDWNYVNKFSPINNKTNIFI